MNKQLASEINAAIESARTSSEYESVRVKLGKTALSPMERLRFLTRIEHCERMHRLGGTPSMNYQAPRSLAMVAVAEDMTSGRPDGAIFTVYEKVIGGEWAPTTFYREGDFCEIPVRSVA